MEIKEIFYILILILLAASPISLIIIKILDKSILKTNKELKDVKRLCLKVKNVLIKDYLIVKTIIYDNIKIKATDLSNTLQISTLDKNESKSIEKVNLHKDDTIRLIASILQLCDFQKTKEIDKTISNFFNQCRLNKSLLEKDYKVIDKVTEYKNKRITTIISQKISSKEIFAFSKGNPFEIIEKCNKIIENGKKEPLDSQRKRKLKKQIETLNKKGQKVIAFAYRAMPIKKLEKYTEEYVENELTYIGLVTVSNPIDRSLINTIEKIKKSNLKLHILTKLKERNTVAIAKELNLVNPQYFETITGSYLEGLKEKKLKKILSNKEKDIIFCELDSKQKNLILKTLEEIGEKAFYTYKKSEYNLEKIFKDIKRSKTINKNSNKLILHSIPIKIVEIIIILIAIPLNIFPPIAIFTILFIDIIVNLGLELSIRETNSNKKNKNLTIQILIHSSIISLIIIPLIFWNLMRLGWSIGESTEKIFQITQNTSTIILLILITIQILRAYLLNNGKNIYLLLTSTLSIVAVYYILSQTSLHRWFNIETLNSTQYQIIALIALSMTATTILIKSFRQKI